MHFYPHHIGDFLKDTSSLTPEESYYYLRLVWLYYDTEKPLPDDIPCLAFKIGARGKDDLVRNLIQIYFRYDSDLKSYTHQRIEDEIRKYQGKAASAKRANQIRWGSEKNLKSDVKSEAKQIVTSNQEPVTNNNTHTQTREREDSKNVDNFVDNRFIVKDDFALSKSDPRVVQNCRKLGLDVDDIDDVDYSQALMAFVAHNTGVRFGSEGAAILKFCSSYLKNAALQKFKILKEKNKTQQFKTAQERDLERRKQEMEDFIAAEEKRDAEKARLIGGGVCDE